MGVKKTVMGVVSAGWKHWRHGRRSYLLALFGSCVVPFGIIYSGVLATVAVFVGWIAFFVKAVTFLDMSGNVQEDFVYEFLAWCGAMVLMHLAVPVAAVSIHNRKVRRSDVTRRDSPRPARTGSS